MNLTLDSYGEIKDENGVYRAGISTTLKPKKISVQGDDVVFEGAQVWDENPTVFPKDTAVTITFKHAKIEFNVHSSQDKSRDLDDIEDVEVSGNFELSESDKEQGYKHTLIFSDNNRNSWDLMYRSAEISYMLPNK